MKYRENNDSNKQKTRTDDGEVRGFQSTITRQTKRKAILLTWPRQIRLAPGNRSRANPLFATPVARRVRSLPNLAEAGATK